MLLKFVLFGILKEWIMEQWEKNYYISAVAGATNGSSLVVMSKGKPMIICLVLPDFFYAFSSDLIWSIQYRHSVFAAILQSQRVFSIQVDKQEVEGRILCYLHGHCWKQMGSHYVSWCRIFRSGFMLLCILSVVQCVNKSFMLD